MVYVYDILVNLNEELYDFYDWEENDNLLHIRRVPLFKVNHNSLCDFMFNKVKVSKEFLNIIKDKTQVFSLKNIDLIPYMAIISDEKNSICVMFNNNGVTTKMSNFLVNEEREISELAVSNEITNIDYEVLSKIKYNNMIRSDRIILENIINELESIKDSQVKIDYLYYEWFDSSNGVNKYETLIKDLKKEFTKKHLEFLELLHLLTIKK